MRHGSMEGQRRLDTPDLGLIQGPAQPVDGVVATPGVDHDLGDEVVVLGGHLIPSLESRIDADARPTRHGPARQPAGRRSEVPAGIFGADANLDRVATGVGRPSRGPHCRRGQWPSGGQLELLSDDVQAGDQFRDPVLDLKAGVDLQEEERSVRATQELCRCRVLESGRTRDPHGQLVKVHSISTGESGSRGLLDQFLVASLERAIPLPDRHDIAFRVTQELDLYMPGRTYFALEIDGAIPECRGRLPGTVRQ